MTEYPNSAKNKKAPWMQQTLATQLSRERDFKVPTPTKFQYAILCTHRSGSNLLSETLFETGVAGDPMEFFNLRMLKKLYEERNVPTIPFDEYINEMKMRRTSPNGVFGFNLKMDQLQIYFKPNFTTGADFIKRSDFVVFLFRKDKIRQAVSNYIGNQADTFRIPAGVDDNAIKKFVENVPFNPSKISLLLQKIIRQEQAWICFLNTYNIPYHKVAYEEFVVDYENTIDFILDQIGVPEKDRRIPSMPTKKISNTKNEELTVKFTEWITGSGDMEELLPSHLRAGFRLPDGV